MRRKLRQCHCWWMRCMGCDKRQHVSKFAHLWQDICFIFRRSYNQEPYCCVKRSRTAIGCTLNSVLRWLCVVRASTTNFLRFSFFFNTILIFKWHEMRNRPQNFFGFSFCRLGKLRTKCVVSSDHEKCTKRFYFLFFFQRKQKQRHFRQK